MLCPVSVSLYMGGTSHICSDCVQAVAVLVKAICSPGQRFMVLMHYQCLQDALVSRITRKSIDVLKLHFKEDMTRADWQLVVKLKKTFQID